MKFRLLFFGLVATVAACGNYEIASPQATAAAQRFAPPSDGKSTLYIFRNSTIGSAVPFNVTVDGKLIGQIGSPMFYRLDVEPGLHRAGCTTDESRAQTAVEIAAGEIRFVEISSGAGWMAPRCSMSEVNRAVAEPSIRRARLAEIQI